MYRGVIASILLSCLLIDMTSNFDARMQSL